MPKKWLIVSIFRSGITLKKFDVKIALQTSDLARLHLLLETVAENDSLRPSSFGDWPRQFYGFLQPGQAPLIIF